MNPVDIPGSNKTFKAPRDWDEAKRGPCGDLKVIDTGETIQSAWQPEPQELAMLVRGAPVVLTVWGRGIPAVAVSVLDLDVTKNS